MSFFSVVEKEVNGAPRAWKVVAYLEEKLVGEVKSAGGETCVET